MHTKSCECDLSVKNSKKVYMMFRSNYFILLRNFNNLPLPFDHFSEGPLGFQLHLFCWSSHCRRERGKNKKEKGEIKLKGRNEEGKREGGTRGR